MSTPIQQERHVDLEGTTNLRNLGGYRTIDGSKQTKWGPLYRCDQPNKVPLEVAEAVLVQQLHVHHTFDLRSEGEVAANPYSIPNITRHAVPIGATGTSEVSQLAKSDRELKDSSEASRMMQESYREFVRTYGSPFGALVKGFLDNEPSSENAALIHCTAGKDRTGWAVYVILTLLDITEAEKHTDYLLTNTYYKPSQEMIDYLISLGMDEETIKVLTTASDDFLDAAIDEANKIGGVKAYAKSRMGLTDEDIEKLRDVMLEDVHDTA